LKIASTAAPAGIAKIEDASTVTTATPTGCARRRQSVRLAPIPTATSSPRSPAPRPSHRVLSPAIPIPIAIRNIAVSTSQSRSVRLSPGSA
jgi:hypothetical protein